MKPSIHFYLQVVCAVKYENDWISQDSIQR